MPSKPKSFNTKHKATEQKRVDTRATSASRGYDSAWQKLRGLYIAAHPLCEWPGCNAGADVVDHVQPISTRPDLRLTISNLQSLCRTHHAVKTHRDQKRC